MFNEPGLTAHTIVIDPNLSLESNMMRVFTAIKGAFASLKANEMLNGTAACWLTSGDITLQTLACHTDPEDPTVALADNLHVSMRPILGALMVVKQEVGPEASEIALSEVVKVMTEALRLDATKVLPIGGANLVAQISELKGEAPTDGGA